MGMAPSLMGAFSSRILRRLGASTKVALIIFPARARATLGQLLVELIESPHIIFRYLEPFSTLPDGLHIRPFIFNLQSKEMHEANSITNLDSMRSSGKLSVVSETALNISTACVELTPVLLFRLWHKSINLHGKPPLTWALNLTSVSRRQAYCPLYLVKKLDWFGRYPSLAPHSQLLFKTKPHHHEHRFNQLFWLNLLKRTIQHPHIKQVLPPKKHARNPPSLQTHHPL